MKYSIYLSPKKKNSKTINNKYAKNKKLIQRITLE